MTRDDREVVDELSTLEFVSFLGQGGFGSVALMRDSKSTLYAEKSSPIYYINNLEKEHRIMLRFRNHPRIVQTTSPSLHVDINLQRCCIYMEFASKGTLHNMISSFRSQPMPEVMVGRAALMILQGLEALHSRGYAHCDLKPANVLIFPSKSVGQPWDLKLGDFGLSREPCSDPWSLSGGTKQYMPPEAVGTNGAMMMMGPGVDVWSLGCVVLEMFGGRPEKMGDIYAWRLPQLVSPMASDFLRRCMECQPSRRATAGDLLKHPFVAPETVMRRVIPPPALRDNAMKGVPRMMKMATIPGDLIGC
ncbi:Protein kinase superfamily protein [Raphanus sativus]|uniref:Mitogen-activated protein kinase kinase kinase 20-like n=1 Tax=Raphanus sativus TaxID=3726 RepID=A0A9W3BV37_RAPSA|nr:mitogen-activated protein kinase kinase kinase 20-like [Raphanus sativus]KAJ4888729.1 Protein kinase superfamily protein [Raphanus sativus]